MEEYSFVVIALRKMLSAKFVIRNGRKKFFLFKQTFKNSRKSFAQIVYGTDRWRSILNIKRHTQVVLKLNKLKVPWKMKN